MAVKKKDLATELIDDLLGEAQEQPPVPGTAAELKLGQTGASDDATLRLSKSQIVTSSVQLPGTAKTKGLNLDNEVRTSVGRYAVKPGSGLQSGTEAHLFQVENLRVAQQKILDLEDELAGLRQENEQLVAAGEALRRENEDIYTKMESADRKMSSVKENVSHEKEILEQSNKAKDRELKELRIKVSEFETRLSSNLQKIRVRERELENRLELIKMENGALARNKDEMLLDLKRQIDQMSVELENYRKKTQELNRRVMDKQELLRRTVKALRLALSLLEGEEGSGQ